MNIKPETWVSHFESHATVDDKFVDRVSELQHLVEWFVWLFWV